MRMEPLDRTTSVIITTSLGFSHRHTRRAYIDRRNPSSTYLTTSVLTYKDLPVISFDVVYVSGLTNSFDDESDVKIASSFPSFVYEDGELERGWMTWSRTSEL